MSTDPHRPHRDSPSSEGRASLDEDWTQLRTLLLSPEQTQLDELRDRLDNRAVQPREISRVLPEAFAMRGETDQHLSKVLTPYVENGFVAAVRKSPRAIVDAIAPIIGPAIRQSIQQVFNEMVQTLNEALEHSMSAKGLSWRYEAWKTGRPFGEVILLHTLVYRVEQVYLVHRETGLLLHHVATGAAVVQDQHVLSGMLTAIQSYVRDSFGASQDQTLDQFHVGDWTVRIEQGSRAYLAAVVRGSPPAKLREDLRDALDRIHAEYADSLSAFDGDAAAFHAARPHLEGCLQAHYEPPPRPSALKLWILGGAVMLALSWWGLMIYQTHARWSNLLAGLRAEPGIVVTVAKSTWGAYHLEGLRDPLAKDPSAMVSEAGFDSSTVKATWSSYYALEPQLVSTRAQSMLQPPSTVKLTLEGNTLVATGSAPIEWARETKRLAPLIPGIIHYRDEDLVTRSVPDLLTQINQTVVHFSPGSSAVEKGELAALSSVAALLGQLDQSAFRSGQSVALEIRGSADETGPESINVQLSKARADAVRTVLGGERLGEATTIITDIVTGAKQRTPKRDSANQRIASLHARLVQVGKEISPP
jgi:OOP family OmpA-OmpF porin